MAGLVGFVLVCWFALAVAASAQAQTIHVTSSLDPDPNSNLTTLRQAITSASNGDIIVIDPGVNPTLSQGPISLGTDITIEGQGARSTMISAPGGSIFQSQVQSINTTIIGLTLAGATNAANSMLSFEDAGNVALTDVALVGKGATQRQTPGGAITICSGNLTLDRVTITNNTAANGGGIAVFSCGPPTKVAITDSTITGNTANHGDGGAIYDSSGAVTLNADTIVGNTAVGRVGGNIYADSSAGGTVTLNDTIVAGGVGGNCGVGAGVGGFTSNGNNLEDSNGVDCGLAAPGDMINANPMLGSLGNFGGQTDTIPLLPGSQAIDAVPLASCIPGTDQRGAPRPDGSETTCDIGAYESQDSSAVTVACSPAALIVGQQTTCTATVTNPAVANALTPTGTFAFSSDSSGTFGGGATCTLAGGGGSAGCSVLYTPTAVGSGLHTLTAKYSGDNAYPAGSAGATVTVALRPVSTTVACSPAGVSAGATTTCTATVSDAAGGTPQPPSGTIVFTSSGAGAFGGNAQCLLSGSGGSASCVVTYTPSVAASGGQTITASYPGDATYAGQNGSTTLQVVFVSVFVQSKHLSSTGVSCSTGVLSVGRSTACKVTVSDATGGAKSAPTGTVSLAGAIGLSGPSSCSLTSSGATSATCSAVFTLTSSGAGTFTITATYGGDQSFNAGSSVTSIASSPQAGVAADVKVVSGTVVIELKGSGNPQTAVAAAGIESLVPLKGETVSVPVGSTIDTRKGVLALTTAADYRAPIASQHVVQTGTFSVAIFAILQQTERQALARARKLHRHRVSAPPSTDLKLETPQGGVARARCRRVGSPGKGVVRALSGTAKGLYRTIGAASITTIVNATWVVKDRCDGTVTEVGRGHATVTPRHPGRSHRHSVVVGPGQGILIKGRFA